MKKIYLSAITALLFASCSTSDKKSASDAVVVQKIFTGRINDSTIYNFDTISKVKEQLTSGEKLAAKKLFLQAMDLFLNKKNPAESISLFRKSIFIDPNVKSYYSLGCAYIENKNYNEALSALSAAEYLEYDPVGNMYYQTARAYAGNGKSEEAVGSLFAALDNGYMNKDELMSEKLFEPLKSDQKFASMIVQYFKDEVSYKEMLYKNFLAIFPDSILPAKIERDSLYAFNYSKTLSYDYAALVPDMKNGEFSRDVSEEYMYVGKFKVNENITAIIYKDIYTMTDTMNAVNTYLCTFDSTGTLLQSLNIACSCSPTELKSAEINAGKQITVTEWEQKWETDPLENGYRGNKISETKQTGITVYTIDGKGNFLNDKNEIVSTQTGKK